MKVGHVPLIPYHRPGDPQVAELVAAAHRGYGRTRHADPRGDARARSGPNVWHAALPQARRCWRSWKRPRRLWLLCQPRPAPLAEAQIEDLRRQFGASW